MEFDRRRLLQAGGIAALATLAGCSSGSESTTRTPASLSKPAAEMSYEEWTTAQSSATIDVDQHSLEVGFLEAGSGPLLILLHGIPTSSYIWRNVVDPLSESYRVVVPDMVGYGNSTMHDGFDRSIRAQEQVVEGLRTEFGAETISYVGHDLGGGVGLRYAVHNPETVDQLVLSDAVSYDSWPVEAIVNLGIPATIQSMSVSEVRTFLSGVFRQTLVSDTPDQSFIDAMIAPWDSEQGVLSLSRNAIATNTNHTTEIDPSKITADTLLLWGADDQAQPISYGEQLQEDIDKATLTPVENASHWVMQDQPETYRDELVAFLAS